MKPIRIHASRKYGNTKLPFIFGATSLKKSWSYSAAAVDPSKLVSTFRLISNESRQAKSDQEFSPFLIDQFQRRHDYLRISLSERCNLRCFYCMPEEGVQQSSTHNLLTSQEIYLLSRLFVSQGVKKIRLTGGEPTLRQDIIPLMYRLGSLKSTGLQELCLTTNGISLHRHLEQMVSAGLTSVNISLDTLDPWKFQIITRRNGLEAVQKSINRVLEMKKMGTPIKLKVNCVIIRGINDQEISSFVGLVREKDMEVRFIEYMPFYGNKWNMSKMLMFKEMLHMIKLEYPSLIKIQNSQNETSKTYKIPGFNGRVGFITSMTHNFCSSCNRLRITSEGNLKVCLFANAEVSLRNIIRRSNHGNPIDETAFDQIMRRKKSVPPIDKFSLYESQLLEVIGMAVRGKKEKHAGIGQLNKLKNRPMVLIGG